MEGVLFVIDLADLEIPIYSVDDFRANSDPLDRTNTRPETFVLSGVRSPRTHAALVTCSTRPPSQPFQLRVIVTTMTIAKRSTINGVPYFCQAGLRRDERSTTLGAVEGDGIVAGVGEVAICVRLLLESLWRTYG